MLKGSRESGFSFEALGTCMSATTGCIIVRVAKVLKDTATLPSSSQPLQEGQVVTWPQNLIALYKTPDEEKPSDANNSKGTVHVAYFMTDACAVIYVNKSLCDNT